MLSTGLCICKLYQRNQLLETEIENSKKIYIYDLEAVVASSNLVTLKQEFEQKIQELSKELEEAQKKIKSIKDSKIKADFSDVYLNSLKLKRDDMVKAYDEIMIQATENINIAVKEVVIAKKASTIVSSKSITVKTDYVVDLTPEISALVKQKNSVLRLPSGCSYISLRADRASWMVPSSI